MTWLMLALVAGAQESDPQAVPEAVVTELPTILEEVPAEYPEEARRQGLEASVGLQIDLAADGAVEEVYVVDPATPPGLGFDEAAVHAVRQYRFTPATFDGEPAPVRIDYRVHFVLEDQPVEAPAAPGIPNFTGVVRERGTRSRLPGVRVRVVAPSGDTFESITDDQGRFSFTDLTPEAWRVQITGAGVRPFDSQETLTKGVRTEVTYFVFPEVTDEFDVMVEGEEPRKEVSRHKLTVAEVKQVPGTFGDPLAVVQNLPGVSPQGFGDGTLVVRGSSPEDTGLFLAGARLPLFYHFGGLRSVLPVEMISEITFYPGNAPLEYGRITGGVLEVSPAELNPDMVHGHVDINLFDASGFLVAPLSDTLSIAVGGRRSYFDAILGVAIPEDSGFQLTAAPQFHDYQALISWRPNDRHDLQLFYLGSGDRFVAVFDNPRDLDPQFTASSFDGTLRQQHVALYHDWRPTDRVHNALRVGGLIADQDFQTGPEIRLRFRSDQFVLRDILSLQPHDRVGIRAGLDGVAGVDRIDAYLAAPVKEGEFFAYEQDANRLVEDTVPRVEGGAFAELTLEPLAGLQLIGGVRGDYFGQLDDATIDPRATVRWQVNDALALKAGAGTFHQAPTADESAPEFGNPDIEPEAATHGSAGVEFTPTPWFRVDVTGFYNRLYNSVNQTDRGIEQPDGTTKPLRYDNSGEGRVYGFEVLVKHELHRNFNGWIAYTLSRAERKDGFSSGPDAWRYFDYDRPHVLTAVGSYQLPRAWQLSGRFRWMSGQPRTPIVGRVFVSDEDLFTPIVGDINSERGLAIHTLDVKINKRWAFRRWALDGYIDVQNVYNNRKTGAVSYNYDYTETEAAPGLPIFPALGIRAEW